MYLFAGCAHVCSCMWEPEEAVKSPGTRLQVVVQSVLLNLSHLGKGTVFNQKPQELHSSRAGWDLKSIKDIVRWDLQERSQEELCASL